MSPDKREMRDRPSRLSRPQTQRAIYRAGIVILGLIMGESVTVLTLWALGLIGGPGLRVALVVYGLLFVALFALGYTLKRGGVVPRRWFQRSSGNSA